MKVSDYIVEFLISKGVTDVFGYPGGMVTHLMDSFAKYGDRIHAHVNYHEQASAFAACSYAQVKRVPGVAYATSGPGATNLITGIANAFFDSIPTMFITGQVNTYELKGKLPIRQRGFQETNIVSMVKEITKYSVLIEDPQNVPYEFEKAYYECVSGRRGPVLLDIPMDVSRSDIEVEKCRCFQQPATFQKLFDVQEVMQCLNASRKPALLVGNGISIADARDEFWKLAGKLRVPIVTSMVSIECIRDNSDLYFGFIGAYGHRSANFILQNSDLIICLGSRLDCRQTGNDLSSFAPSAKLIRIDIDENQNR